ncbi:MAG: hypothetical protein ACE5D0_11085 [Fidelibacterota bacterium]
MNAALQFPVKPLHEYGVRMSERKKRRYLSAEQKWQVYQECQQPNAKIGEILRRHGLYSSDLVRIRRTVEAGALEALANSIPGRKQIRTVPKDEYIRLQAELDEKQKALAEMSVLFTSLKIKSGLPKDGILPALITVLFRPRF